MTTGVFEYDPTTGAKVGALTLLGQMVGYDGSGDGIYIPLDVKFLGASTLPKVAGPPLLTAAMFDRDEADISWVPNVDSSDTPPVTSWTVHRRTSTDNGVTFGAFSEITGSPFAAATHSSHRSGLSTGTPEIIFSYRVRGVNSIGDGEWSNEAAAQYQGTPTQQPTAPTNLVRGTLSNTSVALQWSETADASVTKHGIFRNGTLVVDNLGATTTSTTWTGLTPGTTYSNVDVRRFNPFGWSPPSNSLTFTTTGTPPPPVTMMMGAAAAGDVPTNHGGTEVWDGWRVYTESRLYEYANRTGTQRPKFMAYSESGPNLGGTAPNYTTIFNHCRTVLDDFYYGGTGQTFSSRWGIKLYWSNGNENSDKGALATTPHSATAISNMVTSQKALYDAVHFIDPVTSNRRYPDARAGSNPTTFHEFRGWVQDWLHPCARYMDFVMWSTYPPNFKNPPIPNPIFNYPSFNESDRTLNPNGFILRCFYRTAQARAQARIDTGDPLRDLEICVGEVGISQNTADATCRPYYMVHAICGAYIKLSQQYSLTIPWACYWDNQVTSSVNPDLRFQSEPAGTSPSTREAWQNWQTYNHQFGGTHPAAWAGNPKAAWPTTGPEV